MINDKQRLQNRKAIADKPNQITRIDYHITGHLKFLDHHLLLFCSLTRLNLETVFLEVISVSVPSGYLMIIFSLLVLSSIFLFSVIFLFVITASPTGRILCLINISSLNSEVPLVCSNYLEKVELIIP